MIEISISTSFLIRSDSDVITFTITFFESVFVSSLLKKKYWNGNSVYLSSGLNIVNIDIFRIPGRSTEANPMPTDGRNSIEYAFYAKDKHNQTNRISITRESSSIYDMLEYD